jgi:GcrA cell cycle regulator
MAPEPMPFAIVEEVVVPEKERVGVEGLGPHQCRWPIGDPQSPDFHFCHHKRIGGISYCEIHARRAYRPLEEQPREIRRAASAQQRVREDA